MNQEYSLTKLKKNLHFFQEVFKSKKIISICAFLLGMLFLYAAYNKVIIYKTFVYQLKNSPITGGYENILAWLVPGLEIAIVIMLILGKTRLIGLWVGFVLMLLFTIYVYVVPHFFNNLQTCSCGGIISGFTWKQHFWFNLSFTLIAGLALSVFPQRQSEIKT